MTSIMNHDNRVISLIMDMMMTNQLIPSLISFQLLFALLSVEQLLLQLNLLDYSVDRMISQIVVVSAEHKEGD